MFDSKKIVRQLDRKVIFIHSRASPPFGSLGRLVGPSLGKNLKNISELGVKGMLPLGCLPLWGREGVTLTVFLSFF